MPSTYNKLFVNKTEFPVSIDFLPVELEKHETMRVEARNEITTKEKSPSLVSNSPHSIIAPYQAEKLPLPSPSGNIDDQDMSQAKKYKPVYSDSGATSDSDSEIERSRVEERQENSDISIESSVICEDLSDLENVMDET
ncbi:hypothetical protein BGZ76_005368 [Entomortierella beljakovae]|nr:hypothetical protein BGZ76_005368 [Entomortierella beljakovae]